MLIPIFFFEAHAELFPDTKKSHCHAFAGKWTDGKCHSRLEFQQKPIKLGLVKTDLKQWCHARDGRPVHTRRGFKCKGAKSQGLQRYQYKDPNFNLDAYNDVIKLCLETRDWKNQDCLVSDSRKSYTSYSYTDTSTLGSTLYNFLVENLYDNLFNWFSFPDGEYERRMIQTELRNTMESQSLNSCQKACLTKCATSKILDYDHSIGKGPHPYSTEKLYGDRRGVCTEYSRLNKDIGDLTETQVKMRGNLKDWHSYNLYFIRGQWYFGEPQSSYCDFYHTKKTLNLYKKEIPNYRGQETTINKIKITRKRR